MEKINYFSVNISNVNDEHVGTMVVNDLSSEQLKDKLIVALKAFHDCDDITIPDLDINDYLYGRDGIVDILIHREDEDNECSQIYINETWLY